MTESDELPHDTDGAEAQTVRVYTTAGRIYDVHGTETLHKKIGVTTTGHDIRLVEIPKDLYHEQIKHYVTSMNTVMDEQEWKIEQQFGNVIPLVNEEELEGG